MLFASLKAGKTQKGRDDNITENKPRNFNLKYLCGLF